MGRRGLTNRVRRLLAGGATTKVARHHRSTRNRLGTRLFANQAFPGLEIAESNIIADIAMQSVDAADELARGVAHGDALLSSIPVNPELFGMDVSGNRFRYGVRVDFTNPDTNVDQSFLVWIEGPENLTLADVAAEAESIASEIAGDYPERVEGASVPLDLFEAGEIIMIERRY